LQSIDRRYFGGVGQLFDQNLTVGNVGVVVNERSETAFYLVTKQYSGGKPKIQSLSITLKSLLVKMKAMNLTKLGIPKIGCGFDGLDWMQVKELIVSIFAGTRISITVCIPSKVSIRNYQLYCTFYSIIKSLQDIQSRTAAAVESI
jgi:O-acetyl-ADP-ribose deacetylase (regulator of RNase III)